MEIFSALLALCEGNPLSSNITPSHSSARSIRMSCVVTAAWLMLCKTQQWSPWVYNVCKNMLGKTATWLMLCKTQQWSPWVYNVCKNMLGKTATWLMLCKTQQWSPWVYNVCKNMLGKTATWLMLCKTQQWSPWVYNVFKNMLGKTATWLMLCKTQQWSPWVYNVFKNMLGKTATPYSENPAMSLVFLHYIIGLIFHAVRTHRSLVPTPGDHQKETAFIYATGHLYFAKSAHLYHQKMCTQHGGHGQCWISVLHRERKVS